MSRRASASAAADLLSDFEDQAAGSETDGWEAFHYAGDVPMQEPRTPSDAGLAGISVEQAEAVLRAAHRRAVPSPRTPPEPARRGRGRGPAAESEEDETGRPSYPRRREAEQVAARPAASRRAQQRALTGARADFPTLGLQRSHDPAPQLYRYDAIGNLLAGVDVSSPVAPGMPGVVARGFDANRNLDSL